MDCKVIFINDYKLRSSFLKKRILKSRFSEYCLEMNKETAKHYASNTIAHQSAVNFIIDYGIKVENDYHNEYLILKHGYYKTIQFYGIKYYLPLYNFPEEQQKILDYLIENHTIY
jgi:hypothetical protein